METLKDQTTEQAKAVVTLDQVTLPDGQTVTASGLTSASFIDFAENIDDAMQHAINRASEQTATKFELLIRSALVMEPGALNTVLRNAYQPGGRGSESNQHLANWASVVRSCYGAIRFCGVKIDRLVSLGRDAARSEASKALEDAGMKWNGKSNADAVEAKAKREKKKLVEAAMEIEAEASKAGEQVDMAEALTRARERVQEDAAKAIMTKYAKKLDRLLTDFAKDTGTTREQVTLDDVRMLFAEAERIHGQPADM